MTSGTINSCGRGPNGFRRFAHKVRSRSEYSPTGSNETTLPGSSGSVSRPGSRCLCRRHLDSRILRREDEHDILQSMFASFCHGQSMGKTPPCSRHELWKLLVRITMCKVVNTAHRHTAICRDVRKERSHRAAGHETWQSDWIDDQVDHGQACPRRQGLGRRGGRADLESASSRPAADRHLENRGVHQRRNLAEDRQDGCAPSSSSFNSSGRCSRRNSRLLSPRAIWSPRPGARPTVPRVRSPIDPASPSRVIPACLLAS